MPLRQGTHQKGPFVSDVQKGVEMKKSLTGKQDRPDGMEEEDFSHAGGLAERPPRPSGDIEVYS